MRRVPACCVTACVIALLVGCSGAEVTKDAKGIDLTGTVWSGYDSDGDSYVFRFQPEGQLFYTYNGTSYEDGRDTWTQEGARFTVSMTDGYSIYKGEIQGRHIRGEAKNVKGKVWSFDLELQ